MLDTKYIKIEDFKIVDVALHCDWSKLNISISEALNFELPELLCEYYEIVYDTFESVEPTETQLKLLNGEVYKCGKTTKRFLGLKQLLVYYSYSNYLLNSYMNDTGLGFKQKTDSYSLTIPLKDVKDFQIKYRNMAYAIIKQLKEYLCHIPELASNYDLFLECDCGCSDGNCDFTEKRVSKFKPKIIKK